jgi:hypothetical protein
MDQTKPCQYCGRSFSWRKKWEDCWEEVKFCSDGCRKASSSSWATEAEQAILGLLDARGVGKPLNPDEAARALVADQSSRQWRAALKEIMHAARRLSRQGKLNITRKGKVVDPDAVRGVVRLRKR